MKIVVLAKEVPDTYGDRRLDLQNGLRDRHNGEQVLDEICERALEVALKFADGHPNTQVTLLSMGPESASGSLRKGLAMGATDTVHVADAALVGADLETTAEVLAGALKKIGFDLVLTGNRSTDGAAGVLGAMLAELLQVAHLSSLSGVAIDERLVRGRRVAEWGSSLTQAALPALVSITESNPDARFANFKGVMAAKKKPYITLSLSDLDVDPVSDSVGRSIVTAVSKRPSRGAGVKIVDEGDAGAKLAQYLIDAHLA